ncbi:MAG TPA: protein kinase [Candidatus Sulfotelmatobacter sp.]|nr:protein kinase [Candidatus Sulfotelmatobacter sp.]
MIGKNISRYHILQQIGSGGMGVVYRARDEQLERDVAIKVLSPGLLADATARRRFRKEALSLARVNFPSVATIHEFGSEGDLDFLVTEYIPGITLDAKLYGTRLPQREVVQLGLQLAQGLAAAHQHGIVHRDLKPGNLRITPDGRLKILDFGLAQFAPQVNELAQTLTLTNSAELTGTLPYMAPEQLKGEPADSRTDLWAAGAVLYEMTTGKRPFPQTNPAVLINSILNDQPAAPNTVVAGVPADVENIILKALDKDPARRYQSAVEMCVDLERTLHPTNPSRSLDISAVEPKPAPAPVVTPQLRKLGLAALILLALLAGGYFVRSQLRARTQPPAIEAGRTSVAVWGFKNLSGKPEQNWLSGALAEMLTAELSAGDKLRTISGENVARTKADLNLPDSESMSAETLAGIYQRLGSNLIVLGSYINIGGQTRVDVKVQDTAKGETVATLSASQPEAKLLDLVDDLGAQLRAKCAGGTLTPEEAAAVRAAQPETPDAARLYAEGIEKLRAFDNLGASPLLEQAVATEPGNALAHLALARAWGELGYDTKAEGEAKKAYDLSRNFSRKESLLIEANYRVATRAWDRAVDLYKSLWTFYPDDLEYGLRLSDAQVAAGQAQNAITTVNSLRQLSGPLRNDPRIDLAEARSQASLADFRQATSAALAAEKKATKLGARFLIAQALLNQCASLLQLGQYPDAKSKGEQAEVTFRTAGDFRSQAKSLTCLANVAANQGDAASARAMYEKALALARQIGAQNDIAGALINLGNLLANAGPIEESSKQYREALSVAQAAGDISDTQLAESNLAANLMSQGNFTAARAKFESSVETALALDDQKRVLEARMNLGMIASLQGDLDFARSVLEEALQKAQELGLRSYEATCLAALGDVSLAEDDLTLAGKRYQRSLEIRTQLGEKGSIASTQASLATLALEQNRSAQAESLARQAIQEFQLEKLPNQEAGARDVLAQALLAQHKLNEGGTETAAAAALGATDPPTVLSLGITEARVSAAISASSSAVAVQKLQAAFQRARDLGLVPYQLQARLAITEVQMASGAKDKARADLELLARDARQSNCKLIARKADALLSAKPAH